MKTATFVGIIIAFVLCGLIPGLPIGPAQGELIPALKQIPESLSADVKKRLSDRRETLESDYENFKKAGDEFSARPAERQSDAEFQALQAWRDRHIRDVRAFNKEVDAAAKPLNKKQALTTRIKALDKQIKDTETQLQGLGFKQRAEDFEQIGQISREEVARLKAKLLERLCDLSLDMVPQATERLLKTIQAMKPKQVKEMIAALENAGVTEPFLLEWLDSLKSNKARHEVASKTMIALDRIKTAKADYDVIKLINKSTTGGLDANQEAALTLVYLTLDHPYIKGLKPVKKITETGVLTPAGVATVGAAIYDVGEAWFFICALDMNQKDLAAVTRRQFSAQKLLIKRMKSLVEERNKALKELQEP